MDFPYMYYMAINLNFLVKRYLILLEIEKNSILISTDLASRGIHVDRIMKVINFDLPSEKETFLHRMGKQVEQAILEMPSIL